MAVALAALDAQIKISGPKGERMVAVTDFYHPLGNALAADEIIIGVQIPQPTDNNRQVFIKHRVRDTIDFATVSVGLVVSMEGETVADARVVLGAVAPGTVSRHKSRGRPERPTDQQPNRRSRR